MRFLKQIITKAHILGLGFRAYELLIKYGFIITAAGFFDAMEVYILFNRKAFDLFQHIMNCLVLVRCNSDLFQRLITSTMMCLLI